MSTIDGPEDAPVLRPTSGEHRPVLLDLFCSEGGAAMGYHRAGFDVVGVDIDPQPRYPFKFIQADAMTVELEGYDAYHASPPCQGFTSFAKKNGNASSYPDLIAATIARLSATGRPWVVENVPTSPLPATLRLCGSSFGLGVRRHRLFASNVLMLEPPCRHREQGPPIGVYGNGGPKNPGGRGRRYKDRQEASDVMGGLEWMSLHGMCESIPPAYTEWIGRHLLDDLAQPVPAASSTPPVDGGS